MSSRSEQPIVGARAVRNFELPARYEGRWKDEFERRVHGHLRSGVRILDLGSGANPTLPIAERPRDSFYLGLDISRRELEKAPSGSYDEWRITDATEFVGDLENAFDLIVSWQVLEHVKPLERAIENCRRYLRSGGAFVALFSGTLSAFGVVNRVVPRPLGVAAMKHLLGREPETVFPAYYDGTRYAPLRRHFQDWQSAEIVPLFRGAGYFSFSRPLQRAYLLYENWAAAGNRVNLATHYLVEAVK
jgi:SAM-dependent methyltransferase